MGEEPCGREQAVALYRRALAVEPDHVNALYSYAYNLAFTVRRRVRLYYLLLSLLSFDFSIFITCVARGRPE